MARHSSFDGDFLERLSRAEARDSDRQEIDKTHFNFSSTKVNAPPGGASSLGGIFGTEDAADIWATVWFAC